MLQRPLSLRMKDVEVQMKVFAKYSQGGNMISASKSQEMMEQMRQYGGGRKAEQGQEKENARGELSPGRARGRSHRHPEVESTGLMIGGSNSQPPSPRRM
ncbi:hypothetical protein FGO68_gene3444 [Halteria grandinella]|uniref:Uncharacterized protein n=1 Tax=Halteria grandinella TaxID=5974 RepID=A0A8J8P5A7_HALGN|nr:hypothetical protein FGO68_gene3444 [Halteria grandinella]